MRRLKSNGEGGWVDEDGLTWESKADYIMHALGFCCCGDPEAVLTYVGDMLRKISTTGIERGSSADMFFCHWAYGVGITEHGCSVNWSWLEASGEELLADIVEALAEKRSHG